jgi:SsrA-binding protein
LPAAVAQASSLQRGEIKVITATAGKGSSQGGTKVLAKNRKARHLYNIVETFESGIALQGTEVKSVRDARVNLKDSYARVENGELFLYNMHISPYTHGNRFNHEPLRPRKLLMHRREINRLGGYVQEKGLTLVPLSLYLRRGKVKVELALARGKRDYDKRQDIAERDAKREMERAFKDRQQYN